MGGVIMTIRELMEQLSAEQLLAEDKQAEIEAILAKQQTETNETQASTPWYIHVLMGLTAWIGTFFMLFFIMELIGDNNTTMLLTGLLLCAAGVILRWRISHSTFFSQLAFVISLAGQFLFVMGVGNLVNDLTMIILAMIALELLLIVFYRDSVHRFLSTLFIIAGLMLLLVDFERLEGIHGLITLLAAGMLGLWMNETRWIVRGIDHLTRPISFAFVVGLFALLSASLFAEDEIKLWWVSAIALWAILLVQEYILLRHAAMSRFAKLALLGGTSFLLLPALQTPGILAALSILLLGVQRGNRLLIGLATLFLATFITGFYYQLDLTLLVKSFILTSTGLLLFAIRYNLLQQFKSEEATT